VGGLKEKALGAIRGKIKTIIIPERNKKDLDEIPQSIKKKLDFVFAKHMDDILKMSFSNGKRKSPSRRKRKT
jgi:ATP-dependent Lon protease